MDSPSRSEGVLMVVKEMLTHNFPSFTFVATTFIGLAIVLLIILFQFVSIGVLSPLYIVGVGIWAGVLIIVIKAFNVALLQMRTVRLFGIYGIGTIITTLLTLAIIIVNIVAESTSGSESTIWCNHILLMLGIFLLVDEFVMVCMFLWCLFYQYKHRAEPVIRRMPNEPEPPPTEAKPYTHQKHDDHDNFNI